jgi:queuine tRNA-ribosyltransferase
VGTKANVKGILPEQLKTLGAEVVLANTYHLYLQPGEKTVEKAVGLSKFKGWEGPTMTDSGGFQVFSLGAAFGKTLSKFVKEEAPQEDAVAIYDEEVASQHGQLAIIDDEGVSFTSHLDGSLHRFTPERSVEIQHALGADMFFAFDVCTSPTESYEYHKEAMDRTHRWAKRSLDAHWRNIEARNKQALFGIVQGGRFEDLRRESAKEIVNLGFDGIGIGGSFSKEELGKTLEVVIEELPSELPRHLLGIGEPGDILAGIAQGVDLFDCVAATRIGRHGSIYTKRGIVHLRNGQYTEDFSVLDPETVVPGTEKFTRAYVSHLVRSKELTGSVIASLHNVGFILNLMKEAREAIQEGRFDDYRAHFVRNYYQADTPA